MKSIVLKIISTLCFGFGIFMYSAFVTGITAGGNVLPTGKALIMLVLVLVTGTVFFAGIVATYINKQKIAIFVAMTAAVLSVVVLITQLLMAKSAFDAEGIPAGTSLFIFVISALPGFIGASLLYYIKRPESANV